MSISLDNRRVDSAHLGESLQIDCFTARELPERRRAILQFLNEDRQGALNHDPRWLEVLPNALGHVPYLLEASHGGQIVGILPLMLVSSFLFRGRFLVSLPYLNGGGVLADDPSAAAGLIQRAVQLADELDANFLELRHEFATAHDRLSAAANQKLHMRLPLPASTDALWSQLKAKVRNQVRKGESHDFSVQWGGENLVREFHQVFSRNMRDLGTPVYSRKLFQEIVTTFSEEAEICILRLQGRPVAGALLMHGRNVTEVPSASSLREYNKTNANMYMYWQLLCRAVERGQKTFDFGRSSEDSGTYQFKKQWGANPTPATWQYYVRHGEANQMRPDNGHYDRLIRIWQKLPLPLTRVMGPLIVRGIP